MSTTSVATVAESCPVKSPEYHLTLARANQINPGSARVFLSQWYAFSASIPELLCACAMKAVSEAERANIVTNLYSELGLDSDGVSHPELLKDLIHQATGGLPDGEIVTQSTRAFLDRLRTAVLNGDPAFNAGALRALEAVAYSILDVLKEILVKSGNRALVGHAYITIHEEIEAVHIDNTEENISFHQGKEELVSHGYSVMMNEWRAFWSSAYDSLTGCK